MTDVRNLDIEIDTAKEMVAMKDAIERLRKNRDFKKVIEVGYFQKFAQDLVTQRGMQAFRASPELIEANLRKIDACGEMQNFLNQVYANGLRSEHALKEKHELRAEILAGEE